MKSWEQIKEELYVGSKPEDDSIDLVIDTLSTKYNPPSKKLGIYAGSFNPFHVGHLNIVEKAERILGRGNVLLAIGCNPAKTSMADNTERAKELSEKLGRDVIAYTSFLHKLILKKESEGYEVVLIRGLRNAEDVAYEDNQLKFIYDFLDFIEIEYNLNVMFLRCDHKYDHISSSAIRQIASVDEEGVELSKKYLV